jgi:hypothetical protein
MSDPSPLVIVLCKKCGRALGSLDTMPDDWSGKLTVLRCPKCVIPSVRRITGVLAKQQATGGFPLWQEIPLTKLERYARKARRKGSAEKVQVPAITAPRW